MKAALVVLFFAASALAQDPSAAVAAETACGPKEITFDPSRTRSSTPHHNPRPAKRWSIGSRISDDALIAAVPVSA